MTIRSGTITVSINSVSVIFAAEKKNSFIKTQNRLKKSAFLRLKDACCCVSFLSEMNTCKSGLKGQNEMTKKEHSNDMLFLDYVSNY